MKIREDYEYVSKRDFNDIPQPYYLLSLPTHSKSIILDKLSLSLSLSLSLISPTTKDSPPYIFYLLHLLSSLYSFLSPLLTYPFPSIPLYSSHLGRAIGARVLLGDRDVDITLSRLATAVSNSSSKRYSNIYTPNTYCNLLSAHPITP